MSTSAFPLAFIKKFLYVFLKKIRILKVSWKEFLLTVSSSTDTCNAPEQPAILRSFSNVSYSAITLQAKVNKLFCVLIFRESIMAYKFNLRHFSHSFFKLFNTFLTTYQSEYHC